MEVTPALKAALDAHTTEDLFNLICAGLERMDYKQLLEVNRQATNLIKHERATKSNAFAVGEVVEFTSTKGSGTHRCKIDRIGSQFVWLTKLRGDGTPMERIEHPGFKVTSTMLTKIEAPAPAPAPAPHEPEEEPKAADYFEPSEMTMKEEREAEPGPGTALPTADSDLAGSW